MLTDQLRACFSLNMWSKLFSYTKDYFFLSKFMKTEARLLSLWVALCFSTVSPEGSSTRKNSPHCICTCHNDGVSAWAGASKHEGLH